MNGTKAISPVDQLLCYSDVLGHHIARKMVARAIRADRVPHAYFFRGPDGVGKKLFGRGLAAALNCRGSEPGRACGQCRSCRKFQSANHPDFLVVRPEKGMLKIAQIREMCKALSYPPYESDLRVVLLEDVHTMRQEAANSLLKTLEEPPPGNLLILTADTSQDVLPTITSRCQVVPFYGLPAEDCLQILNAHLPDLPREDADLLARLSEGSPGKALLMQQHAMIPTLRKVVGLVADPEMDGSRDVGLLLQAAEEAASLKEHLSTLLGLIRLWLRDVMVGRDCCESGGGAGDPQEQASLKVLKNWSSDALFAKLQALDEAEAALLRNCNRSLVCEVLLFRLQE